MYFDDTIYDLSCQLEEKRITFSKGEKKEINPWQTKKVQNEQLSASYKRLKMYSKSSRVLQCSSFLEFKRYLADNSLKLKTANFCKIRLCPMCAWRRSLKVYGQMSKVLEKINNTYCFQFLTLTIKNCYGKDLAATLDKLFHAFKKFSELKVIKNSFVGWFRALEVTYNKTTGQFHPHFHVVLCSRADYYKSDLYISHEEFSNIWKKCLCLSKTDTCIIDIRKFDGKKGVAEATKYTVKSTDYLLESESLTDRQVYYLDSALTNRRLIAYGGMLKKIHRELNLGDAIDGDLVLTDADEQNDGEYIVEMYGWHVGLKNYYKVNINSQNKGDMENVKS